MLISKIKITNYKLFQNEQMIEFPKSKEIIVGNNGTGKSTILEAINLALSGSYHGSSIQNALSQYLFNNNAVNHYISSINSRNFIEPPSIIIEIFFGKSILPVKFRGNNNSEKKDAEGFTFEIKIDKDLSEELQEFIETRPISGLPIELYIATWKTFARQSITPKQIPIKPLFINTTSILHNDRYDTHISSIIRNSFSPQDSINLAKAYRNMVSHFSTDQTVVDISQKISTAKSSNIIDGNISLSVDLGTKNSWEKSIISQVNQIPYEYVGTGTQCLIQTDIALSSFDPDRNIILIEEPETHLSYSSLNRLLSAIEDHTQGQMVITTHSSFVANKLGLDNLLLISRWGKILFPSIPGNNFFKKVSGYDTLRIVLCDKAILVEGDSDELIVQKAYMQIHCGHLPIQDKIDVISTHMAAKRYVEIAEILGTKTAVVHDNDGDIDALRKKYADYVGINKKDNIEIFYSDYVDSRKEEGINYNTLEAEMLRANGLQKLSKILEKVSKDELSLLRYMENNKTECALKIFESSETIIFPDYINRAISYVQ